MDKLKDKNKRRKLKEERLKELGYEELSKEQKEENLEYNLFMLELDKLVEEE